MKKNLEFVELTNYEREEIEGGIAASLALGLFMAGYTIGKDIANRGK